ncbi:MAG: putative DNA-binding domain-containing protein [Saccharospirillaceae bacterium]|nr:DNA-binding domain-containing protein [Pseudomonadales bacterium]NRB77970.1 putative DNA-binding domain-containing protein [Saccharospirillaceae bacterium]
MLNNDIDNLTEPSLLNWQTQFGLSIQNNKECTVSKQSRFSIYKNNVFHSLIEALSAQFPVCRQLVGEDFFKGCAQVYLSNKLPDRADLILIGESFSDFLKDFTHSKKIPYLAQVANLEYTRAKSLHSEDLDCITHEDLSTMDITVLQQQTLIFHPSVFLIQSDFNIFSIWKGHQPNQKMQKSVINTKQNTLIFRDEFRVACIEIDQALFTCLNFWINGQSLIKGIQNTIEVFPEFNPTQVIEFTFSNPLITAVK